MSEILLHYQKVSPTTWVYLSSLLTIALYFKFSRVWSIRNLDLIGLILLAPGLLFVMYGQEVNPAYQQTGYIWLFVVGGLFLVRMLLDAMMVRRPLLEPNLSPGGLTFLGISLLVFLMANVITSKPPPPHPISEAVGVSAVADPVPTSSEPVVADKEAAAEEPLVRYGPGYPYIMRMAKLPTRLLFVKPETAYSATPEYERNLATARTIAIISHLAIVLGMVIIGYRHFANIRLGIAAAVLYLILPYTAILTDRVYHVLLAALLVWAVVMYRRPLVAGILLGLAIGTFYYPLFLLPLWCGFYWQRGVVRFAIGVVSMLLLLVGILYFSPEGVNFWADVRQMFGWMFPKMDHLEGFWGLPFNEPIYRVPVLCAFIAMSITLAFWPAQKNLGTLLSCSAAVMLGTQFWHAMGGGQLMAWYLPLMLLTIFRPNLEDRVALSVLGQWSLVRRKPRLAPVHQAA